MFGIGFNLAQLQHALQTWHQEFSRNHHTDFFTKFFMRQMQKKGWIVEKTIDSVQLRPPEARDHATGSSYREFLTSTDHRELNETPDVGLLEDDTDVIMSEPHSSTTTIAKQRITDIPEANSTSLRR